MAYAEQELKKALSAGLETLIRAVSLKRTALRYQQATVTLGGRLSDYKVSPDAVIFEEINQYLKDEMTSYKFDLAQEPVLAQLGVHRPETKFFSAKLASGGGRSMALQPLSVRKNSLV